MLPGKDFSLASPLTGITYTSKISISFRNVSAIDFNYLILDYFSMNLEATLKEAKSLVRLAKYEPDPITQEMMYLDSILCYVFSGHLMENNGTRKREVIKVYNGTIDLIK